MIVEELIQQLQNTPPHYRVLIGGYWEIVGLRVESENKKITVVTERDDDDEDE